MPTHERLATERYQLWERGGRSWL